MGNEKVVLHILLPFLRRKELQFHKERLFICSKTVQTSSTEYEVKFQ